MIKGLILAIQFFTRIPINITVDFNEKNIRYSIFFMPLVGTIIGGFGGIVYYLIAPHNKLMASFLTLLITIILTGGLHIDGLADTFDGFLANKDRKKTMEIMKDSRIGTFGVLSIVLHLMFLYILIISIDNVPLAMILSFTNSRLIASIIISNKKSAQVNGLGALFHKSNPKKLIILSTIIYLIFLVSINKKYLIPLVINYILAEIISNISYKKIDGLTGDVYGTIIELGVLISLFSFWGVGEWI
ncbi:MAG: adenosylcobinamide-GDP ribazoletransferase [Clostridiales bacterium]|uniref:Adenosylcobinamide-GDP ribazoletransferase n=1 Tax=Clostridium thermopalmarium DSM 5974 TaxID=1121340 RepID=A0A2T0ARZ2_9CLOT|nr:MULTISPECIES: adenosylcobinamide-GDP ribazoletransferase [Clostridium]NLZ50017.1 adenosylcobinamide-GDP ribazoletransferase [Clostridiales bacterium]PRR72698.1 Cobalamin synthase [Clostridium thermopalmarium DSM 5974]PVZ20888.1 cobalamin-5'-phosphate synthase [Clostridium thermopalmarium DSM 5974]SCN26234.1 Cobalamin synthase [Clostridium sp. N3C]